MDFGNRGAAILVNKTKMIAYIVPIIYLDSDLFDIIYIYIYILYFLY